MVTCRACGSQIDGPVLDLGYHPLPNELQSIPREQTFYPLTVHQCHVCDLIQTGHKIDPELLFNADYPYFSSVCNEEHWKNYAEWVQKTYRPKFVIEIGSNDGYLLKHFPDKSRIKGFEPCGNLAEAARRTGVPTETVFFSERDAPAGWADVVIANNVIAHTPDPMDLFRGAAKALTSDGVFIIETPDVEQMISHLSWDTIYHEHHSYPTVAAINYMLRKVGLYIRKVLYTETHGGSLRIVAMKAEPKTTYHIGQVDLRAFAKAAERHVREICETVLKLQLDGVKIAGFGAAAKATTVLHACGLVGAVDYIADDTLWKQGKYMPGTTIPITSADYLAADNPDVVWVFPWNWEEACTKRLRSLGITSEILTTGYGEVKIQ